LETAHIDRRLNGTIRGIFSWLHQAGDIISDRYKICSLLGRGGFAATYLVEDIRLNGKNCALKEIPEILFDAYETNLLSRLNHPSIPDITDQFTLDNMVYLVLKFGGHKTLESVRKFSGGKISLSTLMPWMQQLCCVLDYLHTRNPPVIHRDLKPANILLDDNDRVALIDFGIAKQEEAGLETRTLARAVTHGFSPPEQVGGSGTDPRSDIYAFAATSYAVATGIIPPAAHERLAGKILLEPIQLISTFPQALNNALLRALDLNINNRQASIKEFAAAFDVPDNVVPFLQSTATVVIPENQSPITAASTPIPSVKLKTKNDVPLLTRKPRILWLLIGALLCTSLMIAGFGVWYSQNQPNELTASDNPKKSLTVEQQLSTAKKSDPDVPKSAPPVEKNTDSTLVDSQEMLPNEVTPVSSSQSTSSTTSALDAFNKRRKYADKKSNTRLSSTHKKTRVSKSQYTRRTPARKKSPRYSRKTPQETSRPQKNKAWAKDFKVEWK